MTGEAQAFIYSERIMGLPLNLTVNLIMIM